MAHTKKAVAVSPASSTHTRLFKKTGVSCQRSNVTCNGTFNEHAAILLNNIYSLEQENVAPLRTVRDNKGKGGKDKQLDSFHRDL